MMMPSTRIVIGMAALFVSSNAIGAPFVFNPPAADFVEDAQAVETVGVLGKNPKVIRKSAKIDLKFRQTESGFRLVRTVLGSVYTVDGKRVEDAVETELIGRQISILINRSAEIEQADGYEKVISFPKLKHTPEIKKRLEGAFDPEKRLNELRRVWSLQQGMLIGRDSTVGASWSVERKLNPDPAAKSPTAYIQSRVVDSQEINGEPVATVLSFLSTQKDMLKFVSSEQIKSLNDARVTEFLEWNVATPPFAKFAQRQVLKVNTMELIEFEQFSVRSRKVPTEVLQKERLGVETVMTRELSKFRRIE